MPPAPPHPPFAPLRVTIALFLLLTSCHKSPDPDSPKATARAFVAALKKDDHAAAQAAAHLDNDQQCQTIDAICDLTTAIDHFNAACQKAWPIEANSAPVPNAFDFQSQIDDATESINDNAATLTFKTGSTLHFVKDAGQWRISPDDVISPAATRPSSQIFSDLAKIYQSAANQVDSNSFTSLEAARSSLFRDIQSVLPTTLPAESSPPIPTPQPPPPDQPAAENPPSPPQPAPPQPQAPPRHRTRPTPPATIPDAPQQLSAPPPATTQQ